ncbi:MAG: WD40 repeat domain-containing protein, partial [Christensenellaceae bacterium]|nr:WD40 repeat domain-containing protein [Christensenellaceae bacterium]
ATASGCSFEETGTYLAVTHGGTGKVIVYKRSGDTFSALSALTGIPDGDYGATGCAFTPSGNYLVIALHISSNTTLVAYSRSGDTFTKLSGPALSESYGEDCAVTSDGVYMAVCNNLSPAVSVFKRSGSSFTRLSTPYLPLTGGSDISFRPDGRHLALVLGSALYIYGRSDDTFTETAIPADVKNSVYCAAFSPDGSMLACVRFSYPTDYLPNCYGVYPVSHSPGPGAVVDESQDIAFSWGVYSDLPDIWPQTQLSAKLRWRPQGETAYTEITISGSAQSYTMPAGTLSGDYIEWQVLIEYESGKYTSGSEWITISTVDAVPEKPIPLSPLNEYVDVSDNIRFEWQHVINSGTAQSGADLQYSIEGGAWTDLASVSGSDQFYDCPGGTLPGGSLRWRVRTYNSDGVEGDWSDPAAFVGIGPPAAPSISNITESARPTISWVASGQVGYHLQITKDGAVIYDTGETAGAEKSHTVPFYLANGSYAIRLRYINSSQQWSPWATSGFILAFTPPDTPTISVAAIINGARISISNIDEDAQHVYLLRDGVPIADITGLSTYDDYAALGTVTYVARVVDSNENYADSLPANVTVTVIGAVLAAVDALDAPVKMRLKAAGQPPVTRQKQLIGAANHYAGREHPVFTFSEFSTEVFNPSYYYTSFADWELLEALVNRRQTVLYRDMLGNRIFGAITIHNFTQEDDNRIMFALTIQRVDYVEQIEYAEVDAS